MTPSTDLHWKCPTCPDAWMRVSKALRHPPICSCGGEMHAASPTPTDLTVLDDLRDFRDTYAADSSEWFAVEAARLFVQTKAYQRSLAALPREAPPALADCDCDAALHLEPKHRPTCGAAPAVEHRCGVQGFNQMLGDVCPACSSRVASGRAPGPPVEVPKLQVGDKVKATNYANPVEMTHQHTVDWFNERPFLVESIERIFWRRDDR